MARSLFAFAVLLVAIATNAAAIRMPVSASIGLQQQQTSADLKRRGSSIRPVVAAVLPGDPLVTGTLSQGLSNCVSLYSNIIFARIALSWFPQLPRQFPILQPIFTVTEPYLRAFRNTIPSIGGFDISAIPAIFILDIIGQTVAAVGAEFPEHLKPKETKRGKKATTGSRTSMKKSSLVAAAGPK
jgi:YggT family protein